MDEGIHNCRFERFEQFEGVWRMESEEERKVWREKWMAWIKSASYEDLLRKYRYAPIGDPLFSDKEVSVYYREMMEKGQAENPVAAIEASKRIGWDYGVAMYNAL